MAPPPPPASGIALVGAPDTYIGEKDVPATARGAVVAHFEMTQDVVDEMLASCRNGKLPQINFGLNPYLKYGDTKRVLEPTKEKFRNELYKSDTRGGPSRLGFLGVVERRLTVQSALDDTATVDAALEKLKSNMESIRKEKESSKYNLTLISKRELSLLTQKNRLDINDTKPYRLEQMDKKRQALRGKVAYGRTVFGAKMAQSHPSSPALSAASPRTGAAPTSAPTANTPTTIQQAIRTPVVHLLAVKPTKMQDLLRKTHAPKEDLVAVLQKIAREVAPASGEWKLTDKAYKELDAWKFPYPSQEDRQAAIDNAIRAFDRQRFGPEERIWQILLPEEERGKGKVLSKLTGLGTGAAQKTTPTVKPKLPKKNPLKRIEAKKAEPKKRKAEDGKESAAPRKRVAKATDEEPRKVATKVAPNQSEKQEKVKPVEKEGKLAVKKQQQTNGATMPARKVAKPRTTQPKITEKPFTSTKRVQDNKPKNPSPLSASPPVNASDFEDNHPVHKAFASAVGAGKNTPGNSDRTLKRKANDLDNDIHKHDVGVKQRKTTQGTPLTNMTKASTTPSSGEKILKRKAQEQDSNIKTPATKKLAPPSKIAKTTQTPTPNHSGASSISSTSSARSQHNGVGPTHQHDSPQSLHDSSTSPEPLNMRQVVDLSAKFKKYYEKYHAMYQQLASRDDPPSDSERQEIEKMHQKLVDMKKEINAGATAAKR